MSVIQQAYKYVTSSLWPRLMFFENQKNIEIKQVGTGKELVAMRTVLFIVIGVFPVKLSAFYTFSSRFN